MKKIIALVILAVVAAGFFQPHSAEACAEYAWVCYDILHTGDTYWNGIYPFIDYSTGGSIDGMIAASDANLAVTTNKTIIIPGHGRPVSNKSELQEFRDMLVAIRENVAALKKQGRSRDETVAAKPTAAFDAKWGNSLSIPAFSPDWFMRAFDATLDQRENRKLTIVKECVT